MTQPPDDKTAQVEMELTALDSYLAHEDDCPAGDFAGGACECGLTRIYDAIEARIARLVAAGLTPEEAKVLLCKLESDTVAFWALYENAKDKLRKCAGYER